MPKYKVAIVGATGYTGSELLRFLITHPEVEIQAITSESKSGSRFSDIHPQFLGLVDHTLIKSDDLNIDELDFVFLALPHGVSMDYVKKYYDSNCKIIDLSGDFRLSSKAVYDAWYPKLHTFEKAYEDAVYGMPELHRESIKKASLVANPGCFPTASVLAMYPLFKGQVVDPNSVIIDAKTGVTGAGVKPSNTTHYSNVNDNFKPYKLKSHRHTVEIEEQLTQQYPDQPLVQFSPHLLPVDRGILTTSYAKALDDTFTEQMLIDLYKKTYANEPFVRLRENVPTLKDVRGTNYCDIYVTFDERTQRIIVVSAIDNLVKGAAGQAIHNMNLMADLPEGMGLNQAPVSP